MRVLAMDEATFLRRLQRPHGVRAAHPGTYRPRIAQASYALFQVSLESVGGQSHAVIPLTGLAEAVSAVMSIGGHRRVVAAHAAATLLGSIPGMECAGDAGRSAQWEDVDLAIIAPEMAVCENAAMLVSASSLPERGLPLLAQHVLALVDLAHLTSDMHEAYATMSHGHGGAALPHHLTWISGPSKTADIEQSLVIGAHGCRSMLVLPYTRL
jgi:L-lactate dehydrogenase complex protein LldG